MNRTIEFLDAIKSRHSIVSDYALAKKIGLTPQAISLQRHGKATFDDSTALKVAELLEIDSGIVLAAVHAERAKGEAEKTAWNAILEKLGGIAALVLIGVGGLSAPSPAQASAQSIDGHNVHYVKSRRRRTARADFSTFALAIRNIIKPTPIQAI